MCTTHRKQMLSAGCASGLCPFSPRFLKEKKEHRKPVRWYTRLIVYGNPGRVVNGYAPGIPVLICGFGVVVCGGGLRRGRRTPSFLSPPKDATGAHLPTLLQGNPPSRVLRSSLLRCGEHLRGYPDVASGGYSYPAFRLGLARRVEGRCRS